MKNPLKLKLDKAEFYFVQEGNTLGTTDEYEDLRVSLETQIPGEEPFIVIKSNTGWSINDTEELSNLINKCLGVLKEC